MPGFRRFAHARNFPRNLGNSVILVFFRVTITYKRHICILCAAISVMAACDNKFSSALAYALGKLGVPNITPKTEQRSSIEAIYRGKDVFMWLPTGFRKSLCFHMLPFVMDYKHKLVSSTKSSLVIVVSPLIALMVDQVRSLRSKDVMASILTTPSKDCAVAAELLATESSLTTDTLLFRTPESLLWSRWRQKLEKDLCQRE